jgi:predicted GIY-YIG superfamily endonuclease
MLRFFYVIVSVYVLQSERDNATYVGMALDVTKRLADHNKGKNRYTKGHLPWKVIYTEVHPTWITARVREKYLKSTTGKKWLYKYLEENGEINGFPA